jgi:hypothetical protein
VEEMVVAAATEPATATEMARMTASKTMPMPTIDQQQQQQGRRIQEVSHSKKPHCCLSLGLPPSAAATPAAMQKYWPQWGQGQWQQ